MSAITVKRNLEQLIAWGNYWGGRLGKTCVFAYLPDTGEITAVARGNSSLSANEVLGGIGAVHLTILEPKEPQKIKLNYVEFDEAHPASRPAREVLNVSARAFIEYWNHREPPKKSFWAKLFG